MKKINDEDINILEAEMLNCYLYHAGDTGTLNEQEEFSADEIMFIKKCMVDEISLRGEAQLSQLHELNLLLNHIAQLKEELLGLDDKQKNKHSVIGYKRILYAYLALDFDQHVFQHPKLQRRINGIKNVKKRYEGNLYEKREIIYRVLRETAKIKGRWKCVTAAINDVYPTLEKELKAFDQNWIKNRIAENTGKIAELQDALENNKKRYEGSCDIKIQDRTYINYIKSLEEENREFRRALNAHNVADILKKKMAFNSNDQEQTLLNHVRNCPELLAKIIEKDSK
ncbi:hypothetical protein F909_04152 [Acinetobacter sp. ANC 3929]|uniref:hypothetical protein n=1 Tax=Acinetobacter sp. ANC 3929 TaxID=1217707 RepID=UPI0002CDE836|nr:hypothetical protein [Acinetobacter sp. ANC 3929]ENW78460.1 hypothetical protein F909_04152 [Acinetobacter sp. ANC 3929]